jgi:hypothetical protein
MGNLQVRFLEGWVPAMAPGYSTIMWVPVPLAMGWLLGYSPAPSHLQFPHEPLRTFQSPLLDPVFSGGRTPLVLAWKRCRSPYFWRFAFLVSTS